MTDNPIRVIVNGAHGRMGKQTVATFKANNDFKLVAATIQNEDLAETIQRMQAQVVVDFTTPDAVFENTKIIITAGAHPVIGTTGLSQAQITELSHLCHEKKLGGIIAPNFSIGAILMMRFASQAARHFKDVEIIELHHDRKKDAPSGTAIKTSEMIANQFTHGNNGDDEVPITIPIHSVRLPGLVAHQHVIFGGTGETLTIKHDSIDRQAFMPGVVLACKKVLELHELVYGLEYIIDE